MIPNNATHLAISYEDIQKYLPESQIQNLQQILQSIELGRVSEGKPTNTNFILVDCSELYIDKVIEVINQGEKDKSTKEVVTNDLVVSILNFVRVGANNQKSKKESENVTDSFKKYEIRYFHDFINGDIKYSLIELTYIINDNGYRRQENRLCTTYDYDLVVRIRDLCNEEYNNSRRK